MPGEAPPATVRVVVVRETVAEGQVGTIVLQETVRAIDRAAGVAPTASAAETFPGVVVVTGMHLAAAQKATVDRVLDPAAAEVLRAWDRAVEAAVAVVVVEGEGNSRS